MTDGLWLFLSVCAVCLTGRRWVAAHAVLVLARAWAVLLNSEGSAP